MIAFHDTSKDVIDSYEYNRVDAVFTRSTSGAQYKTGTKTVAWEYELDKKDGKKIHVVSAYSYTVTPHITPLGKPERLEIQRKIRVYLENEGYTVIFH